MMAQRILVCIPSGLAVHVHAYVCVSDVPSFFHNSQDLIVCMHSRSMLLYVFSVFRWFRALRAALSFHVPP